VHLKVVEPVTSISVNLRSCLPVLNRNNGGNKNTQASLYIQLDLAPAPLAYVNQPKERVAVKGYHREIFFFTYLEGNYEEGKHDSLSEMISGSSFCDLGKGKVIS
jgi:hypothetical protein